MAELSNSKTTFHVAGHSSFSDEELMSKNFRLLIEDGNKLKVVLRNIMYDAVVKSFDLESKECVINVSGFDFSVKIEEPLDKLIHDLGFLKSIKHSVKEIKSPMPGLVVNVYVKAGQEVSEGEKLLSLEAMKMENILKAPGSGKIKTIHVVKGNSVEKNQILVEFE